MTNWYSFLLSFALFPCAVASQTSPDVVPAHTILELELQKHAPLRVGQSISAKLIYPVFSRDSLILPKETLFSGTVVALRPDRSRRVRSRFNLDFTPFRIPVVRFTEITLGEGIALPIESEAVADGAIIAHFVRTPSGKQRGFVRQQFDVAGHLIKNTLVFFTASGRGDRLAQLFYHQLPIHPQRIEKGTTWDVETEKEFAAPQSITAKSFETTDVIQGAWTNQVASLTIEATLSESLSSATAKVGQTVHATVAAPVFNAEHTLLIPQGATLIGTVNHAKPGGRFGRAGALRFAFQQIVLPSGTEQMITSNLIGADSTSEQGLVVDFEGEVKPQPRDKIVVPALLLGLAAAPLDADPGDNDEFIKNAGASNSLGLPGFVTGIALRRAGVSAAFGFYGASLSIYDRWIRRGTDVSFPRNTRIILEVDVRRAANSVDEPESPAPNE